MSHLQNSNSVTKPRLKIAIIGAGFSGLSVAWHLLAKEACEIVIYDAKGIGGGASGVATGLLHPYVGEQGRRSMLASEGVQAATELIQAVEKRHYSNIIIQKGIIRYVQNEKQKKMFLSHCCEFGDVKLFTDNGFWIESGLTIDCPLYLEGLWRAVADRGTQLVREEVSDLKALEGFDHVIVAAGAGVKKFPELNELSLSVLKGQVLSCHAPDGVSLPATSIIGKGYVTLASDPRTCFVGSTYERQDLTETPDPEGAKNLLWEKISAFFPSVDQLEIIGCKAALRVVRKEHYFPFVGRIKEGLWVLTGLGSRGLLYHAYLGKLLAESVLAGNDKSLSSLFNNRIVL